jgi:hypothetical protein
VDEDTEALGIWDRDVQWARAVQRCSGENAAALEFWCAGLETVAQESAEE